VQAKETETMKKFTLSTLALTTAMTFGALGAAQAAGDYNTSKDTRMMQKPMQNSQSVSEGRKELQELFVDLDQDRSGLVSMEEYMAFHNKTVNPQQPEYMEFRAIDANDDEMISMAELGDASDPFDPSL
jgi:hypothetical protein